MRSILGQPRAVDVLQRQLATGRLHHAYIFHGPAGVGKFTTALAFARVLLCADAQTDADGFIAACGACESCGMIGSDPTASAHPDLHVVNKELARFSDDSKIRQRKLTQIPVEVLRAELLDPVSRASNMGHGKVFVVDEAELINQDGQNTLLKTLEEPPAGTTIILVSAHEHRLFPTIRSRCQRIAFTPLPGEVVQRWVDEHADDLSAAETSWLVDFVSGSLGRAQLALDYELTGWAGTVLPQLDALADGRPTPQLGRDIAERINTFAESWVDAHENASKEAANKLGTTLMWSLIARRAQQRIEALSRSCDPADPIASEAALEPWLGVIDALREAETHRAFNVNLGLVCDHAAVSMARSLAAAGR